MRILGTIQERLSAVVDGIFSLEPQRIRLSGLGQSRELQLPRTTTSAPAALWHSGAMPAANTEETQQAEACSGRNQR